MRRKICEAGVRRLELLTIRFIIDNLNYELCSSRIDTYPYSTKPLQILPVLS